MHNSPMNVAGIMSGTSADGIDVALVRLSGKEWNVRIRLLAHRHFRFPKAVRKKIWDLANANSARAADFARMNVLLAELYAEAVLKTLRATKLKIDLAGCHGQTLYHQGEPEMFLGKRISCTWQCGEGAVLAARLQVPVVSDFRPADIAAEGKGAPLVPLLDYIFFRHPRRGRILQNLGGIGNLTAIFAKAEPNDVVAFDTGPGNMVIDALAHNLFRRPYDDQGRIAARGKVLDDVLHACLNHPFFSTPPPRTAGREEFGREFTADLIRRCKRRQGVRNEDILATATALTAASIERSVRKYVLSRPNRKRGRDAFQDFIVSGGGARNRTLMKMIAERVLPMGLKLSTSEDFGMPSEAKEAIAFALLAYRTWNREPGNMPSATGARRPAILGKISFP